MSILAEIFVAFLLIVGGFFGLVGSWSLVRFPDPMTRLHGPTKSATLGVGAVLLASMAAAWLFRGVISWHELLITIFVLLTAPITGMFIAKAHLHLSWKRDELPLPAPDVEWATYGDTAAESPMIVTDEANLPRSE